MSLRVILQSTTHEYYNSVSLLFVILLYTLLVVTLEYVIREPPTSLFPTVNFLLLLLCFTHYSTLSPCLSPHSRAHFLCSRAGHKLSRPLITTAVLCRCVVLRQYASCLRIRPHPRPTVPLCCCVFILFTDCEFFLILNLPSFSNFFYVLPVLCYHGTQRGSHVLSCLWRRLASPSGGRFVLSALWF